MLIELTLLILMSQSLAHSSPYSKLNISFYYESYCKFSRQFMQKQLMPVYEKIKSEVTLKFFPFGMAESFLTADGEIEFKCQHGKQECDGNKFQSCALHLNPQPDRQAEIVFCTMTPHHFYGDCIEELNLDGDKIYECFNGTLGTILQLFAESKSMRVLDQLQGVPAIVFNGEVDTSSSFSSLNSFEKVLESKIDRSHSPKSSKCNE